MAGYFYESSCIWARLKAPQNTTDSRKYPAILAGQPSNKIYVLFSIVLYCIIVLCFLHCFSLRLVEEHIGRHCQFVAQMPRCANTRLFERMLGIVLYCIVLYCFVL